MYSSFDSGKIISAVGYIDVEEMSNCLAHAISRHVEFFITNY